MKKKRKLTSNPPSGWKIHINLRLKMKMYLPAFLGPELTGTVM